MSKPRSTRIRKGIEVIDNGRHAVVTRTTTLTAGGPMADLLYTDTKETGCARIADLTRADQAYTKPAPATEATLTAADIERMYDHEDYAGWGYLFERSHHDAGRVAAADAKALDAANRLGLTYEQLFDWANSRVGRWYGDCMLGANGRHGEKYVPGATGF